MSTATSTPDQQQPAPYLPTPVRRQKIYTRYAKREISAADVVDLTAELQDFEEQESWRWRTAGFFFTLVRAALSPAWGRREH